MLAIGNEELKNAPNLGDHVTCWICGAEHPVKFGKKKVDGEWVESKEIGCFRCGGKSYLCGIGGKEIRPKEDSDGYTN
jgi:hypothetical protein